MKLSQYLVTCLLIVGCSAGQDLSSQGASQDIDKTQYSVLDFAVDTCGNNQTLFTHNSIFKFAGRTNKPLKVEFLTHDSRSSSTDSLLVEVNTQASAGSTIQYDVAGVESLYASDNAEEYHRIRVYYPKVLTYKESTSAVDGSAYWIGCKQDTDEAVVDTNAIDTWNLANAASPAHFTGFTRLLPLLADATCTDQQQEHAHLTFQAKGKNSGSEDNTIAIIDNKWNVVGYQVIYDGASDTNKPEVVRTDDKETGTGTVVTQATSGRAEDLVSISLKLNGFNKQAFDELLGASTTVKEAFCVPGITVIK